jgi:hypothetical protein
MKKDLRHNQGLIQEFQPYEKITNVTKKIHKWSFLASKKIQIVILFLSRILANLDLSDIHHAK